MIENHKALNGFDPYQWGINSLAADWYFDRLRQHIFCVMWAGEIMDVCSDQLEEHDASKFSREEFPAYALNFYMKAGNHLYATPEKKAQIKEDFKKALAHHYRHNPHHWNHWVNDGVASPMPEHYVREMLADWAGAGATYQGTWDISEWVTKQLKSKTFNIHPQTRFHIVRIMCEIGYKQAPDNKEAFLPTVDVCELFGEYMPRAFGVFEQESQYQVLPDGWLDSIRTYSNNLDKMWSVQG